LGNVSDIRIPILQVRNRPLRKLGGHDSVIAGNVLKHAFDALLQLDVERPGEEHHHNLTVRIKSTPESLSQFSRRIVASDKNGASRSAASRRLAASAAASGVFTKYAIFSVC
jgi:hypothetical protein